MPAAPDQSPARIAIVTDAGCDVPSVERAQLGGSVPWLVLAETWREGAVRVVDHGEPDRTLVQLALAGLATPEPPPQSAFERVYAELDDVERVYSLHASARISPTLAVARAAAGHYPRVRVVDTGSAGLAVGLLARRLQRLAGDGAPVSGIDAIVAGQPPRLHYVLVPDRFDPTLDRRRSAALLLGGAALLTAREGDLHASRRLRSRRATVAAIRRYVERHMPADLPVPVAIGHGDAAGAVDPLLDILERDRPNAVVELVGRVGPRLVRHVGARCVGVAWLHD